MNLLAAAPDWLAWSLAALTLLAAAEDSVRLRISNVFPALVVAGAIATIFMQGAEISVWQNVLVFAALLGVGTLLFARGAMGGGDVKLLAAIGLWCDLQTLLTMLASVLLSGGILALLILGLRSVVGTSPSSRAMILRPKSGIPYGMAIAAGLLITLITQRS